LAKNRQPIKNAAGRESINLPSLERFVETSRKKYRRRTIDFNSFDDNNLSQSKPSP
jgi:hypothetical protein